jgi:hypothetical protein
MITTLLMLASATPDVTYVGRFDPSSFPNAAKAARVLPQAELNRTVQHVLAKRQCRISGQTKDRFNIAVRYAVLLDSAGQATKVVVEEMACEPIETMVGQIVLRMSKAGDFKSRPATGVQWYLGEVSFAQGSERFVQASGDPDKVVCKEFGTTGSRIAKTKDCRTNAQWRAYYADREQNGRDLQKWVATQPSGQ